MRFLLIVLLPLTLLLSACERGAKPVTSIEVAAIGAQSAALSDDGKWALIGSVHHGGSLWRTADGERLYDWNHRKGETTVIDVADFSPDGNWALTADRHTLVLWNVNTGAGERFWTAPGEVLSIALSEGGQFALLGLSDFRAVLFDVRRGGIRRVFNHTNRVRSVALSADERLAITGSEDYSAIVWDVASGKPLLAQKHEDDVQLVTLSRDGRIALSVAKYDRAALWNTETGQELGNIPLGDEKLRRGVRFSAARFSRDGKQLLTGRPDQTVQLWDVQTQRQLARWQLPKRDAWKPTNAAALAVAFGGTSGTYYAVASNGFVHKLKMPN